MSWTIDVIFAVNTTLAGSSYKEHCDKGGELSNRQRRSHFTFILLFLRKYFNSLRYTE